MNIDVCTHLRDVCIGGEFGGSGAVPRGLSGDSGISHSYAHVAQSDEKHNRLAANDERGNERKETGGVFREPGRANKFGIWALGIFALFGGVLFGYIAAPLGGIWPPRE
jgi:hypothetical protein